MHCCNINKSRRGGFFLVHLVYTAEIFSVIAVYGASAHGPRRSVMAFSVSAVYRTVDVQLSCTSTVLYTALRTPPASSLTAPETSPHGWAPTGCMRLNPQKTQLARFTTAGEDNNRSALQSQDWSPRLRPVASRTNHRLILTRPVLKVTTGLGFATRPR